MPRNGAGTYTVPNTFVPGTDVEAPPVNGNFSDIATALTNSIAADGQTVANAPIRFADGTEPAPSITFAGDNSTGFYLKQTGVIGVVVNGQEVLTLDVNTSDVPTGSVKAFLGTTPPAGYLMMNGETLSSAPSSGGSGIHARDDGFPLYELIWNSITFPSNNTQSPVVEGMGGSALSDWNNGYSITLPDLRGRAIFGLDNMGGVGNAGIITTTTMGLNPNNSPTTNGALGGVETFQLKQNEIPAHTHDLGHGHLDTFGISDSGHGHGNDFSITSDGGHIHTVEFGEYLIVANGTNAVRADQRTPTGQGSGTASHRGVADGTHSHTINGGIQNSATGVSISGSVTDVPTLGGNLTGDGGALVEIPAGCDRPLGRTPDPSTPGEPANYLGDAHNNLSPAYLTNWIVKL